MSVSSLLRGARPGARLDNDVCLRRLCDPYLALRLQRRNLTEFVMTLLDGAKLKTLHITTQETNDPPGEADEQFFNQLDHEPTNCNPPRRLISPFQIGLMPPQWLAGGRQAGRQVALRRPWAFTRAGDRALATQAHLHLVPCCRRLSPGSEDRQPHSLGRLRSDRAANGIRKRATPDDLHVCRTRQSSSKTSRGSGVNAEGRSK